MHTIFQCYKVFIYFSISIEFALETLIWKCSTQNVGHFCQDAMCLPSVDKCCSLLLLGNHCAACCSRMKQLRCCHEIAHGIGSHSLPGLKCLVIWFYYKVACFEKCSTETHIVNTFPGFLSWNFNLPYLLNIMFIWQHRSGYVPYICTLGKAQVFYLLNSHSLKGIGVPFINIRQSDNCLWILVTIPIPIRWYLLNTLRQRQNGHFSQTTLWNTCPWMKTLEFR